MGHDVRVSSFTSKSVDEVARDLRAFAGAGVDPAHAKKLLAVAAELEALITCQDGAAAAITE